jgi:acyl transferase domain-containing protein/acyl carrier protein
MSKIRSIQTLMRDQQDNANIFETLASLYVNGVSLNLDRLFWSPLYRRVSLPLYPFRRDRHWVHADLTVDNAPEVKVDLHPLLSRAVNVGPRRIVFETSLSTTRPWTDHRVLGTTVFPGTAYLEMAARGFAAFTGEDWRPVVLQNVVFERPLLLIYGKPKKVSLTLENLAPKGGGQTTFAIATAGSGNPENYCRGRIAAASESGEKISVETELSRREAKLEIGPFYGELRKSGLEYGANFATVRELWQGRPNSGEAIGRVTISPVNQETDNHSFTNAVLLDGCLQVFGAALKTLSSNEHHGAFIPASIQSVTLRSQLPSQVWSHASARMSNDSQAALVHIHIWNDSGEVLAEIDGLELRQKMSFAPTPKGRETATSTTVPTGDQPAGSRFESRDQLINHLQKLPKSQRVQVLTKWLASEVKDIMGRAAEELDLDNIEPSTAFLEIGLDSLLVTELQRRIQEKLAFRFQPMQGLDYQSIESLAEYILDEVLVLGRNGDSTTGQRKTLVGKSDM